MNDEKLSEQEVQQILEVSEGYLEEAENALWTAAERAEADDISQEVEELTRLVWDVQHSLYDLQRALETREIHEQQPSKDKLGD